VCEERLRHTIVGEVAHILVKKSDQNTDSANRMSIKFSNIARNIMHLDLFELPRYRIEEENNVGLRIQYLRNLITKEQFQKKVQQANKKYEKNREIYGILQLLITTVTDILYRVKQKIIECNDGQYTEASNTLLEVDTINQYTNECLVGIVDTYNNKSLKNILLY
jgi:hypothetical protein